MATLDQLPMWLRAAMKVYRWRRVSPVPLASLTKPLAACRVALVTTAGLVPAGGEPFDESIRGGDWSYRVIAGDADVASLAEFHRRSRSGYPFGAPHDRELQRAILLALLALLIDAWPDAAQTKQR